MKRILKTRQPHGGDKKEKGQSFNRPFAVKLLYAILRFRDGLYGNK